MSTDSIPPVFTFSWRFFARDVPGMLRRRVFGPRPAESAFVSHAQLGQTLALFACLGLAGLTAQSARNGSGLSIAILGIALIGVIALIVHSAWEARSYPLSPDAFAIGPFIACVILGGDVGLVIGRGADVMPLTRIAYAAIGMLVGYILGGLVGLYTQRLGWFAGFFSFFAFVGSAGLILLAVILFV